jgi:hypothetical protein
MSHLITHSTCKQSGIARVKMTYQLMHAHANCSKTALLILCTLTINNAKLELLTHDNFQHDSG